MEGPHRWIDLPENHSAGRAVHAFGTCCIQGLEQPTLLLHGPPGSGKSHLVQDLVRRVLTASSERTAQVHAAADLGRELQLPPIERRDLMRSLAGSDLLVLEDVQHLPRLVADDIATVLDRRTNRRKPSLLTAGTPPAQLTTSARLASRLTGGLVIGITPLAQASRRTLAEALSVEHSLKLTPDVLTWLARHPGGARPIIGELRQLATLAQFHPPPLSLELIQRELPALAEDSTPLDRIIQCVASHFRITPKLLCGKSRLKNVVWPRQVAMYLARQQGMSLVAIGRRFAQRDHTTVLHSCTKVEQLQQTKPELAMLLQELHARLV